MVSHTASDAFDYDDSIIDLLFWNALSLALPTLGKYPCVRFGFPRALLSGFNRPSNMCKRSLRIEKMPSLHQISDEVGKTTC
jgi:hypothetical protein